MPRPNFFLIGAPKCGTTAMAQYLGENPRIFMPNLKEPGFWSADIPLPAGDALSVYPQTLPAYLDLFQGASREQLAIGEASTSYAWSEIAVRRILEFQPDARFICMVRNPLEMVHALHATELFFLNEPLRDFESAWRSRNERINSLDPQLRIKLDYRRIASLGAQIASLFRAAPARQRHVIVYDDFVHNPRQCYENALAFLDVPSDGRSLFPVVNGAKAHRFGLAPRLLMQPPEWIQPWLKQVCRPLLVQLGIRGVRERILAMFSVQRARPKLPPSLIAELAREFHDDVELLSDLLGRDLRYWLAPSNPPPDESRARVDASSHPETVGA